MHVGFFHMVHRFTLYNKYPKNISVFFHSVDIDN